MHIMFKPVVLIRSSFGVVRAHIEIYIYIYVFIYIYIYTSICQWSARVSVYARLHTNARTHTHTYINQVSARLFMPVYFKARDRMHALTHACPPACTHTRTHAHTHTRRQAQTHKASCAVYCTSCPVYMSQQSQVGVNALNSKPAVGISYCNFKQYMQAIYSYLLELLPF
jgi:hypothetical protein